jgi:hypothetical protein
VSSDSDVMKSIPKAHHLQQWFMALSMSEIPFLSSDTLSPLPTLHQQLPFIAFMVIFIMKLFI